MCGIFGIIKRQKTEQTERYLTELFRLSESRGKEASGMAVEDERFIRVLKTPFPAGHLIKTREYRDVLRNLSASSVKIIGHSRLVTNGDENDNKNNQPIIRNGMVVVHNGIITNQREIWDGINDDQPQTELDSELIPVLVDQKVAKENDIAGALSHLYDTIYGMTSIAVLFEDREELVLATNNGSLYFLNEEEKEVFVFASERHILNQFCDTFKHLQLNKKAIHQLKPLHFLVVAESRVSIYPMGLKHPVTLTRRVPKGAKLKDIPNPAKNNRNASLVHHASSVPKAFTDLVLQRTESIDALRRCTRCVLPETFPFIRFDAEGVCTYCRHYRPLEFKGAEEFKALTHTFISADKSKADCLVPFSGGRDSSFALHYLKEELGLKPLAFSYDWGMLTDLSRRNQARMCGALGVEHILISADIRKKRQNIRKNVEAWLKRPHLGTIPLFMAGDKQYFYFANRLMQQNGLHLSVMGENMLETTRFKTGFCGIAPDFTGEHTYSLSGTDKLKMMFFYGKEYLLNPSYINTSLLDTFDAFKSYYVIKHQNVNLFDYLKWDEHEVESLLIDRYAWETDPETKTTWRIGDGTAAFYNYIYYMVAGFTENDTFRSNQIREGMITREEALRRVQEENSPRWGSIQWYCSTIGLDFPKVIQIVNKIPTNYGK
jgi:glucosamine--fructose-6-phosphate aminotransferase (isomerizing)